MKKAILIILLLAIVGIGAYFIIKSQKRKSLIDKAVAKCLKDGADSCDAGRSGFEQLTNQQLEAYLAGNLS